MTPGLQLNAVTLGVDDVARTAAFYERLGWERSPVSAPNMAVLSASPSGVLILHRRDDLESSAKAPAGSGFGGVVLTMAVDSPAAVHRTLARAVDAGATVLRPATQLGYAGSHACFADPDGHVWEVIQTPGFEVDEAGTLSLPQQRPPRPTTRGATSG